MVNKSDRQSHNLVVRVSEQAWVKKKLYNGIETMRGFCPWEWPLKDFNSNFLTSFVSIRDVIRLIAHLLQCGLHLIGCWHLVYLVINLGQSRVFTPFLPTGRISHLTLLLKLPEAWGVVLLQKLLVSLIQLLKILNAANVLGALHLFAHNPLIHSLHLWFVLIWLILGHFQKLFPQKVLCLIDQFSF
jgi:hypothetical protein